MSTTSMSETYLISFYIITITPSCKNREGEYVFYAIYIVIISAAIHTMRAIPKTPACFISFTAK
jgi:hypothetical protein